MKAINSVFKFIFAILMMVFGIFLIFLPFNEIYDFVHHYYVQLLDQFPEDALVREFVAGVIALVGLIIVWPMVLGRKKERAISFTGMHGPVNIELKYVESTLEKVAGKLPEVIKAKITLEPTDSPGRACVLATVELYKNADDDARMITARVQHYIQVHTKKILGLNDVDVRLTVKRFKMKMSTLKIEPLLLEGPLAAAGMGVAEAAAADVDEEIAAESENEADEVATSDSADDLQLER